MKKDLGFVNYLVEREKRQKRFFKDYLRYAKKIKIIAQKELGNVRVIVFGSILKKNEVPQDIDVLIISSKFKDYKKRREVLVKMWEAFDEYAPFEFHLITPEDYQNWYKNFIKKKVEIR